MQAEQGFAAGLLDPQAPVPAHVTGQWPRRYAVYRNNVTVGLVRALEANFPVLRRLLGEEYFAGLARKFAQENPPASPLLFHYGMELPAYLERQSDLKHYPYLGDVARLEQAWRRAHHAADHAALPPSALALPGDELLSLTLTPHPAMALLASDYAIHAIFNSNRAGGDGRGRVDDPTRPEAVLLTRPAWDVEIRLLQAGEHDFLAALAGGASLSDAAALAMDASQSFDLAAAIRLMVEAGAFTDPDSQEQP